MKKVVFAFLLILILIILVNLINKNISTSKNTENVVSTSNITLKTYEHPFLHFSFKYPSDILYPDFVNIDPNSTENQQLAKDIPGIRLYMNNVYITRGFDSGPELNLGFLRLNEGKNFITDKYLGINFIVYYFPKNIESLRDYFGSNKDVYFSKINNQTVLVLDHTKAIDGDPPSWAKFYFIKFGNNLLKIGTFIPAEFANKEDKKRVFELFEEVSKTISFKNF